MVRSASGLYVFVWDPYSFPFILHSIILDHGCGAGFTLFDKRYIFHIVLVRSEAEKQACYNLESVPLLLSNWTSLTSWWVELWPPDLVSHLASFPESQQFINQVRETGALPALHPLCRLLATRRIILHTGCTLPVTVCSVLRFCTFRAWQAVYEEKVYLAGKPLYPSVVWPLWTHCLVDFHSDHTTYDKLLLSHKYALKAAFGFCHLCCQCMLCHVL